MNEKIFNLRALLSRREEVFNIEDIHEFQSEREKYYKSLNGWSINLLKQESSSILDFLNQYDADMKITNWLHKSDNSFWPKQISGDLSTKERRLKFALTKLKRVFYYRTNEIITNSAKKARYLIHKDSSCNCQLIQDLEIIHRSPPSEAIKKIGNYTDGYYQYELFRCQECNRYWVNDLFSDSNPNRGFVSFSKIHKTETVDEIMKLVETQKQRN